MDKQLTDVELREVEIGLLNRIHNICKENDIEYFLAGGTLLGAVRHKGYIPWDDDIDIYMKREEFSKFDDYFRKNKFDDIEFHSYALNNDCPHAYSRLCDTRTILVFENLSGICEGVYVDIFPIDNIPSNPIRVKIFAHTIKILGLMRWKSLSVQHIRARNKYRDPFKYLLYKLSHMLGTKRIVKMINKRVQKYNKMKTEYCSSNTIFPIKLSKAVFESIIEVPFEGRMYNAPVGMHEYLTAHYGDYMELPSEKERVTQHVFKAYWK